VDDLYERLNHVKYQDGNLCVDGLRNKELVLATVAAAASPTRLVLTPRARRRQSNNTPVAMMSMPDSRALASAQPPSTPSPFDVRPGLQRLARELLAQAHAVFASFNKVCAEVEDMHAVLGAVDGLDGSPAACRARQPMLETAAAQLSALHGRLMTAAVANLQLAVAASFGEARRPIEEALLCGMAAVGGGGVEALAAADRNAVDRVCQWQWRPRALIGHMQTAAPATVVVARDVFRSASAATADSAFGDSGDAVDKSEARGRLERLLKMLCSRGAWVRVVDPPLAERLAIAASGSRAVDDVAGVLRAAGTIDGVIVDTVFMAPDRFQYVLAHTDAATHLPMRRTTGATAAVVMRFANGVSLQCFPPRAAAIAGRRPTSIACTGRVR
jgi:hypothetical protein